MLGAVREKGSAIWPAVRSRSLSISRMRRRVGSRSALKRRFNGYIIRKVSKYSQQFFFDVAQATAAWPRSFVQWAARAGGYQLNPDCSLRAQFSDKILASVRER